MRLLPDNHKSKGFTLVELLFVFFILLIIVFIALSRLNLFKNQANLDLTGQEIISVLELARTQTTASRDETVYGVHFDTDKVTLFKGSTYDPAAPENIETNLDGVEVFLVDLLDGTDDLIFDRIRGTTGNPGEVSIRLIADTSKTKIISINDQGSASFSQTASISGTRLSDTRHLHFDLGWSIQTATTLTLSFTQSGGGTVTNNVTMASYFNGPKTEFDWEGVTSVDGVDQTIRVHTHALDVSNTMLSVHRDRQKNTKAVTISIDGKQIVSYTAGGAATVGNFGGTMTAQ